MALIPFSLVLSRFSAIFLSSRWKILCKFKVICSLFSEKREYYPDLYKTKERKCQHRFAVHPPSKYIRWAKKICIEFILRLTKISTKCFFLLFLKSFIPFDISKSIWNLEEDDEDIVRIMSDTICGSRWRDFWVENFGLVPHMYIRRGKKTRS